MQKRGYVSGHTVADFLSVGYTRDQLMELLLGVALKTISNYVDHISPVPLDEQYAGPPGDFNVHTGTIGSMLIGDMDHDLQHEGRRGILDLLNAIRPS